MDKMKKITAVLMAAIMIFSLSSCGKKSEKNTENEKTTAESKTAAVNGKTEKTDKSHKDAENKTNDNEEKSKEAERKVITIKAQYDKEKALLNQKSTWSGMWMKFGQQRYNYDENFTKVSEYAQHNNITK